MYNNKNTIQAIDKNHLKQLIIKEMLLNGNECDLNFIEISGVADLSWLFYDSNFNGDISNWDACNVKNMKGMFYSSKFNGDISNWNTSNVLDMQQLFYDSKFNGDISNWDTSNVINMSRMFFKSEFNGDISNWDIQNIKELNFIFNSLNSKNIPYWAKIKESNERIKAYQVYHAKKEKNVLLNNINENNLLNITKNKKIIKI